jgi:signal peptidase II
VIDLLVSGGVLLFLDQWSKRLVEMHVANGCVSWARLLRIRRVRNGRNIYGSINARAAQGVIWFASLAAALILCRGSTRFQSHTVLIGLGSAFGGAAGNLLDMLRRRPIIDFIDLGWWPVFNVADVAITVGIVLAFWPRN